MTWKTWFTPVGGNAPLWWFQWCCNQSGQWNVLDGWQWHFLPLKHCDAHSSHHWILHHFQRWTCNCNSNCQSSSSIIALQSGCPFLQLKVIAPTNQKQGKCPQRSFLKPCLKENAFCNLGSFATFSQRKGVSWRLFSFAKISDINQKIYEGGGS